jgi:hypothetical protein
VKCEGICQDLLPCKNSAFAVCKGCGKRLCSNHVAIIDHICMPRLMRKLEIVPESMRKHIKRQFKESWAEMTDVYRLNAENYKLYAKFEKWFERGYLRGMKHEQH